MRRKWILAFIAVLFLCMAAGCSEEETAQLIQETADALEDPHVLSVKGGHPTNYPDQTYGEAFDKFFGEPAWRYFVGTKEGSDEDGDGEPDTVEENVEIVEFTGYCTYQEVEVKALIQFTLSEDGETFAATYLDFNEVPQSNFMLMALLEKVFSEEEGDIGEQPEAESSEQTKQETEQEMEPSEQTEQETEQTMDMSGIVDSYVRESGPKCSLSIQTADAEGISFAMGIGMSGYLAYVDMRECQAAWVSDDKAVYTDGDYQIEITVQQDGFLELKENKPCPYNEDFSLSGIYIQSGLWEDSCDFVFPEDNVYELTEADLEGKTAMECKIARNEIYARHGRMFNDEQLQGYFESCAWYAGTIPPESFSEDLLNEVERKNLELIAAYEAAMGY